MPTLRRRGPYARHQAPAIRETLRGIARKHGTLPRRAAALTVTEIRKLSRACGAGLADAPNRVLPW